MTKGKSKRFKVSRAKSFYDLAEVRQKIDDGQWLIRSNAMQDALCDFGWGTNDILDAYRKLQPKHFYKTDNSKVKFQLVIDVYKARLNGEDIYTHFYVDDTLNKLIINSFKRE